VYSPRFDYPIAASGSWQAVRGKRFVASGSWQAVRGKRFVASGSWQAVRGKPRAIERESLIALIGFIKATHHGRRILTESSSIDRVTFALTSKPV
jgi:hypothetical protein